MVEKLELEDISDDEATQMYDSRSRLVHGRGLGFLSEEQKTRYKKMERILSLTIRKSLFDRNFREFISNPQEIRSLWPVD